jgi:hypothetical protein
MDSNQQYRYVLVNQQQHGDSQVCSCTYVLRPASHLRTSNAPSIAYLTTAKQFARHVLIRGIQMLKRHLPHRMILALLFRLLLLAAAMIQHGDSCRNS